jgi:hypothetical protein
MSNDDFKQLVLNKVHLVTRYELDRRELHGLSANSAVDYVEHVGRELAVYLDTYMLGLREQIIDIDEKWPEDWWQAFRERWFPKWWLRRHPVRYKEVSVHQEIFKAVCPHTQAPPDSDACRIWFAEKAGLKKAPS